MFLTIFIILTIIFIIVLITKNFDPDSITMKCGHSIKYQYRALEGFYGICREFVNNKSKELGLKMYKIKIHSTTIHIDEIPENIWDKLDYGR